MFLDAIGIILKKSRSSLYKVVLLDKVHGKIECITTKPSLSVGTLITYNIRQDNTAYFINDCTLIYAPLSLARVDILFFHHILELIYYGTYIGNSVSAIFDLIAFLYTTEPTTISLSFKKVFLLKLLTCMDIIPEENNYRIGTITHLNNINNKQLPTISLNTADEKELDKWLWSCVWQHPYVNEFKTVRFLAENRVP